MFLLSVEVTQEKSKQEHTSKNNTGAHATVHGDRTLCLVQVKAVTNHWELGAGAEVGLIEMNFMVEEDGRRRWHLIKHELFYPLFVSTSWGPKFKPVFVGPKPGDAGKSVSAAME